MSPALRALAWFWIGLLVVVSGTVILLQLRGPLRSRTGAAVAEHRPAPTLPAPSPRRSSSIAPAVATPAVAHTTPAATVIVASEPALEEPAPDYVGAVLPRIGADGRTPMRAYAAAAVAMDGRPRIAVLLTGIGLSAAEDETALDSLPAAISFAVSPYSDRPDALLQKMREHGHECFLSLPMEPQAFPIDDPGPEALLTGNTEGVNQQRLEWAMSRVAGYVGATGAMGALRGERFANSSTQMAPVLRELSSRGIMYVDARAGAPVTPGVIGRSVDVVVDASEVGSETDAKFAQLEALARDHGSAVALAGPPHPAIVARIASWADTLTARGFALVPVSALVPSSASKAAASAAAP